MPEPALLIVGPAADAEESAASLAMLRAINLPGALKYVVTHGKLETAGAAKTFNAEGGYPPATPMLRSLSAFAEVSFETDERLRDGFGLHCLMRILAKLETAVNHAVVLRDSSGFEQQWPVLQQAAIGRQFVTFAECLPEPEGGASARNVLFNLGEGTRTREMLELAWGLYATGSAYALSPYSLNAALTCAEEAQRLLGAGGWQHKTQ